MTATLARRTPVLVTGPTSEPVSLQLAMGQASVTEPDDTSLIQLYISAARAMVEKETNLALMPQTWRLFLDAWPDGNEIELPRPPLQSVTHVKYRDADAVESTFSASGNYVVDTASKPGRIVLENDASWPSASLRLANPIEIEYVAGYANEAAVPVEARQAILLLVSHWYKNPDAVVLGSGRLIETAPVAMGAKRLMELIRVPFFV